MLEEGLRNAVYKTIDEINEILPPENKLKKTMETVLYGRSHALSSLQLVNFIAVLEEKLEAELDKKITIVSEKAMSQKNSPFRSIESLVQYIQTILT